MAQSIKINLKEDGIYIKIDWKKLQENALYFLKHKNLRMLLKYYLISHLIPLLLMLRESVASYKDDDPVMVRGTLGYLAKCIIRTNKLNDSKKRKILEFLLRYCCVNPNFRDEYRDTLLEYALFEQKNVILVKLLLKYGVSVSQTLIFYPHLRKAFPVYHCYKNPFEEWPVYPRWFYESKMLWPLIRVIEKIIPKTAGFNKSPTNQERHLIMIKFFAENDMYIEHYPSISNFCKEIIPPSLEQIQGSHKNKAYYRKKSYFKSYKNNDSDLEEDINDQYFYLLYVLKQFDDEKNEDGKNKLRPYIKKICQSLPEEISFKRQNGFDVGVIVHFLPGYDKKIDKITLFKKNILEKLSI